MPQAVTGLVVPWGVVGTVHGRRLRFAPGSLGPVSGGRLLVDHDNSQMVGRSVAAWSAPVGLWARFQLRPVSAVRVVALVRDGRRAGLSVGVDITEWVPDPEQAEVDLVLAATWSETSLVAVPALAGARVTSCE